MTERHVEWVPDQGGWGALSARDALGVQDLPEAVAHIGLRSGNPVYIRPDGVVDRDFLDFVGGTALASVRPAVPRGP